MKDVFLSHANADKEAYVRPLAAELDRQGVSYWLDEAEIRWGDKISLKINEGLQLSRFVVVFLTPDFVGRNWTEAELSSAITRENDEGRIVVLPIVVGAPEKVLAPYPLLRDKSYQRWDEGVEAIVSRLRDLIFLSRPRGPIPVPVVGTPHRVDVSPDLLLEFLAELGTHTIYSPRALAKDLKRFGFLADSTLDQALVVNACRIEPRMPDCGRPGTWSLDLAETVFQLITGDQPELSSYGRGFRYRELLDLLRDELARMSTNPPDPMLPILETPRSTLVPVTAGDLDALLALWTDPDVRRFLWDDREVSREEAAEVLEECIALGEDGLGLWTVRVGGEGALAGCVGLRPADTPPQVEPLAAFHPAHWGSGYATEALRAVLDHAFATLGLPDLVAAVDVPNEASGRLVERLGFRRTEEVQGPKHRMVRYALAAPE